MRSIRRRERERERTGIYGIRFERSGAQIVGERLEDSVGKNFNCLVGGSFALASANDFDNIYPWSQIRRCYVSNTGDISYTRHKEWDEMVEVPIFYYKRVVDETYESLYISGVEREGFRVDPAFLSQDGEVLDHIYVAAYLSGLEGSEIVTRSGVQPLLNLAPSEINNYVQSKGDGWRELDINTLAAIQKLFLVETGVRDSQAVFTGVAKKTFLHGVAGDPKFALCSEDRSNSILIARQWSTETFQVGDKVVVFTANLESGDDMDFDEYNSLIDSDIDLNDKGAASVWYLRTHYDNSEPWIRNVTEVSYSEDTVNICFSGIPVNIVEGQSVIMHLPNENGETDCISYHSGVTLNDGLHSFIYRYIENLWGSACIIVDGANAKGEQLLLADSEPVSFQLPNQARGSGSTYAFECAINEMGYDPLHDNIFLPVALSDGASLTNSYGDWFMRVETEDELYLTYGMGWDMQRYAGLFSYRYNTKGISRLLENGSRLVYVRSVQGTVG